MSKERAGPSPFCFMLLKIKTKKYTSYYNSEMQYHRDNGPTIIRVDGTKLWFRNGKRHRDSGPAIIYSDGSKTWYQNGKYHRDNDLPAVIKSNVYKEWWINGEFIRRETT